jgi:ribose transport system permease protein
MSISNLQNLKSSKNNLKDLLLRNTMVFILLIIFVFFTIKNSEFATFGNFRAVLIAAAPFALIALGQTLVILTGGIDLSVGSIIALSAMSGAYIAVNKTENIWIAASIGVLVGTIAGLINGLIIAILDVPPFVTTLGMLAAASGLAYFIGNGAPINGLPEDWERIANTKLFGFQTPVLVMFLGFIVLAIIMKRTSFGLQIYATGGNRSAAEIAGVNTKKILISVYVISGFLAGLSGVILSSRVISGPPNLGSGYELGAIAAVVIGGASLSGGRGTIWGTFLGLLLIQTLNNGLDILVVPAYWQKVISGVLIVSAVTIDAISMRRSR